MEKIQEIINELTGEIHILIDRSNGEYTSMSKEHWDKLQAEREQSEAL
jgi:hypothetical protein